MIMSGFVAGEFSCWAAWEKYLVVLRLDSGMDWSRSWGKMSVKAQRGCGSLTHLFLPAWTRPPLLQRSPYAISDWDHSWNLYNPHVRTWPDDCDVSPTFKY